MVPLIQTLLEFLITAMPCNLVYQFVEQESNKRLTRKVNVKLTFNVLWCLIYGDTRSNMVDQHNKVKSVNGLDFFSQGKKQKSQPGLRSVEQLG